MATTTTTTTATHDEHSHHHNIINNNDTATTTTTTTKVLWPLEYYNTLRRNNSTTAVVTRMGNLDYLQLNNNNAAGQTATAAEGGEHSVMICHLSSILPFTKGEYFPDRGNFERAANVALAVAHLNSGDGVLVPEIHNLNERCPIRFTAEFADSEYNAGVALNHVVDQVKRNNNDNDQILPCAFVGASKSSVSMPMSIVSGIFGYPQVSPGSTSADLDDKTQYPLFGRTVPPDTGNTLPIVLYVRYSLQAQHLAVISVNDAYGNAYVEGMRQAAASHAPDLIIAQVPLEKGGNVEAAISAVRATGFRFIFAVVFTRETHDALLAEAYRQGVAGTGLHNWLFGDSFVGVLQDRTFAKDSPLDKAYRGVGLLQVSGGFPGLPAFDHYQEQIAQIRQNHGDMAYLGSLFPRHPNKTNYRINGEPPFVDDDTFLNPLTYGFAPFAYEAVVALGLSACNALEEKIRKSENGERGNRPGLQQQQPKQQQQLVASLTGQEHFDAFKRTSFVGVGGSKVLFDPVTGSRKADSALHTVTNWVPVDQEELVVQENSSNGAESTVVMVQFQPVITDLFQRGNWTHLNNYTFNDGTTVLPADLPPPVIPQEERVNWGLVVGLPVTVALILGALTYVFLEHKRAKNDAVWIVPKDDLIFMDPPKVIGRGNFGLVLLAEYRGTQVAVKRVLPLTKKNEEEDKQIKSMHKNKKTKGKPAANKHQDNDSNDENDDDDDDALSAASSSGISGIDTNTALASSQSPSSLGMQSGALPRIGLNSLGSLSNSIRGLGTKRNGGDRNKRTRRQNRTSVNSSITRRKIQKDFMQEMRYLSKLRHPSIATIMGAVLGKDPMLIMEYMEHGSLYDILHNETMVLENDLILPILRDISQGMRFLHTANPQCLHGDLKAANILVDSRFRAKVADFGLSQKQRSGTPFWMAPELIRNESSNTEKTDTYSFGIILYEVYARRDPYEDDDDPGEVLRLVANKHIRKRPGPIPRHMPPLVKSLMEDCVEDDPDKRPSSEELDVRVKRIESETATASTTSNKSASVSLFDIFPRHIAEALRDGRTVEAEHKECVTIFFSDIVGFTTISSELTPQKIASMLDRLYTKFDKLSELHDVFKVETIGDAYMAVSNLVKDQSEDHAKRIACFSLDAIQAANETLIDADNLGKGCVNIRVGFHSGSVVADVVGTRNPRYCLFGDTVNTASRMESNSEVNRIHCSRQAAKLLRKQCKEFPLKSRGKIPIKGKGEMHTFWVNERQADPFRSSANFNNSMFGSHSFESSTEFFMDDNSKLTEESSSTNNASDHHNNNRRKSFSDAITGAAASVVKGTVDGVANVTTSAVTGTAKVVTGAASATLHKGSKAMSSAFHLAESSGRGMIQARRRGTWMDTLEEASSEDLFLSSEFNLGDVETGNNATSVQAPTSVGLDAVPEATEGTAAGAEYDDDEAALAAFAPRSDDEDTPPETTTVPCAMEAAETPKLVAPRTIPEAAPEAAPTVLKEQLEDAEKGSKESSSLSPDASPADGEAKSSPAPAPNDDLVNGEPSSCAKSDCSSLNREPSRSLEERAAAALQKIASSDNVFEDRSEDLSAEAAQTTTAAATTASGTDDDVEKQGGPKVLLSSDVGVPTASVTASSSAGEQETQEEAANGGCCAEKNNSGPRCFSTQEEALQKMASTNMVFEDCSEDFVASSNEEDDDMKQRLAERLGYAGQLVRATDG